MIAVTIESKADFEAMCDDWHRLTRSANDSFDEALKEAQDAAYRLGLKRGQTTANDELLSALKGVVRVADRATDEFDAARSAIAKAEGGAA